jgi:adenylate cyclase
MLRFQVTNDVQNAKWTHGAGPFELGRAPAESGTVPRFVIEDRYVSRNQLRVEAVNDTQVLLENLGALLEFGDGSTLQPKEVRVFSLPVRLTAGYSKIDISVEVPAPLAETNESYVTISRPIRIERDADGEHVVADIGESPSPETLTKWFETLLSVQKAAAGSTEFYQETARAVVDLVGLDTGLVIVRRGGTGWETKAMHEAEGSRFGRVSQAVLNHVLHERRTFYRGLADMQQSASLAQVDAVVASPVFDATDGIVGVVYGSRSITAGAKRPGILPMEARLVQLLAGAVSAGLARMEKEAEAARNRARFEQFASPVVAAELERNPELLEGTEREITVVFSDLRGFSRISEQLGARDTFQLVGDVMDKLTEQVLKHGGIIIDYYGDGLAAMWNAPLDQADHAQLACRAALAMQAELPTISAQWHDRLGKPLQIGVGVNTGPARVGNAGSRMRLKYGPRGHTVNVSSRIEGATKYLGIPVLIAGSTQRLLNAEFATRRICQVRAVGLDGNVELFELRPAPQEASWQQLRALYEPALTNYEAGQWKQSLELLQPLLVDSTQRDDGPTKLLQRLASEALQSPPEKFDPAFKLEGK